MKKKILSGVLALCMIFGSAAALPEGVFETSSTITASAETSGSFEYKVLNNGTVEITGYKGKETKVNIPSKIAGKKVTSIGDKAFENCSKIESVTIPSTVTKLGYMAFNGCDSLTSITIPKSVTYVDEWIFNNCTALKTAKIYSSYIGSYMFDGCSSLTTVEIGSSVDTIKYCAFRNCYSLKEVKIPDSVVKIGGSAFYNCKSIKSLTLGKKVETIGANAFLNCEKITTLTIPGSVSEVNDWAFQGCSSLKSVDIQKGCLEIGESMFDGCTALTNITIPDTVESIGPYAFDGCKSLKSVKIPGSVSEIGARAFRECISLSSLVIEEGVKKIGNEAFLGCKSLKSVIVPQSVKEICYEAFCSCEKLKEVYLLEGLVTIGDLVFSGCDFSVITIPDSVVSIGRNAFGYKEYIDYLKIRGFKGSDAQSYAKDKGFDFEAVDGCKHSSYKTAYTVAPTCTSKGYTVKICTRCSKVTKTNYKAAVAHKFTAWKTTGYNFKNNTSTQTRKCSVCGKTEKQNTKNAVSRLAGDNRYSTAAKLSSTMYKTSDTVVLATGLTYQDALVAVPLASAYDAPLLLGTERHITAQTEAEIKRLKAKNVIVVSTKGAIGDKAKAELKALKLNVTYIEGKTNYETAPKVATALQKKTGKAPDTIFFATDSSFADALTASPVAAIKNAPIIYLKNKGSIDSATANYLKSVKGKVKNAYVIGGDGVISDAMMKNVATALGLTVNKTVVRVAGANRYSTCVEVNNTFKDVLTGTGVCVAKGLDFPDALAGGVYAAKTKQALFLADGKKLQDVQGTYLKGKNAAKITVFGGTGAVPDDLVKLIAKASV